MLPFALNRSTERNVMLSSITLPADSRNRISPKPSLRELFDSLELLSSAPGSLARWRTLQLRYHSVPSFVLIGPRSRRIPLRLALVGGLRSSDVVSSTAVAKFLVELDLASLFARDYAVFSYPLANPPRLNEPEPSFSRDFWQGSSDPVVRFFENELATNELDGVVTIHCEEPLSGLQFRVSSRVIAAEVLWPALEVAQRFVPLAAEPVQVLARSGGTAGAFYNLEGCRPRPFCISIHTPQCSAFADQIAAIGFSLKSIFQQYRALVDEAETF